jgi:hypothetical protein
MLQPAVRAPLARQVQVSFQAQQVVAVVERDGPPRRGQRPHAVVEDHQHHDDGQLAQEARTEPRAGAQPHAGRLEDGRGGADHAGHATGTCPAANR